MAKTPLDVTDVSPSVADPAASRGAGVVKRSLVIAGHSTSVSLEDAFWRALRDIATERNCPVARLIGEIDRRRQGANLSSAIRVFVLEEALARAGARLSQSG